MSEPRPHVKGALRNFVPKDRTRFLLEMMELARWAGIDAQSAKTTFVTSAMCSSMRACMFAQGVRRRSSRNLE
jgi:hypothetical protein